MKPPLIYIYIYYYRYITWNPWNTTTNDLGPKSRWIPVARNFRGPLRSLWLRPLEASRQPPAMSTWNFGSETQHVGKCWFFFWYITSCTSKNEQYSPPKLGLVTSQKMPVPLRREKMLASAGEMAIRHDLTKENSPIVCDFHGDKKPTNQPWYMAIYQEHVGILIGIFAVSKLQFQWAWVNKEWACLGMSHDFTKLVILQDLTWPTKKIGRPFYGNEVGNN